MKLPLGERQSFNFDSNACGIFAVLNAIEFELLNKPNSLGFTNTSDRYIASLIGGLNGNLPTEVVRTIRKYGIIPEEMFPFGGTNQAEYYDKSRITPEMIAEGKKSLELFDVEFEWVKFTNGKEQAIKEAVKECPLVGVYINEGGLSSHAVMIFSENEYLDSYEPYVKPLDINKIHYAIKIKVKFVTGYKYFSPKEIVGLKPELVEKLDKARGLAGIPFVINSGYRTKDHNAEVGGVENSSHTQGLAVDLRARDSHEHFLITKALLDVGFTRISRKYPNHIHCDLSTDKPQQVLF